MIPAFDQDGNLPPGIHLADWEEFVGRFGITTTRRRLLDQLAVVLTHLQKAGCRRVYVNGSFVTAKHEPNDIDVAWEPRGVDVKLLLSLEPLFGDFADERAAQKAKYQCEFFPSSVAADLVGNTFLEFFQIDKMTGNAKGIVLINL